MDHIGADLPRDASTSSSIFGTNGSVIRSRRDGPVTGNPASRAAT
ncbi:hypothetical protein [Nocardioides sp.]|nr:hypothetical protein [Nocardioides sp.]